MAWTVDPVAFTALVACAIEGSGPVAVGALAAAFGAVFGFDFCYIVANKMATALPAGENRPTSPPA